MSIKRYNQTHSKTSNFEVIDTKHKVGLFARDVETKISNEEGKQKISEKNYKKIETPQKSLIRRPVKTVSHIAQERLPEPEIAKDLKIQQALMLLQPGGTNAHTHKALDLLFNYLQDGNRAPDAKAELYKAAELIYEGKISSSNRLLDAARLLYLAVYLAGWKPLDGKSTLDQKIDLLSRNIVQRLYEERDLNRGSTVSNESILADKFCSSLFQTAYLPCILNEEMSIDEMQFAIDQATKGFFLYMPIDHRKIYYDKLNTAIKEGSITKNQLLHHFEFIKYIVLGSIDPNKIPISLKALGLQDLLKALFEANNTRLAFEIISFVFDNLLPLDEKNFNFNRYQEIFYMIHQSLSYCIENGLDENVLELCDRFKVISNMTSQVSFKSLRNEDLVIDIDTGFPDLSDETKYWDYTRDLHKINTLIDKKLIENPNNEILIRAKLKIILAETRLFRQKVIQNNLVLERNRENVQEFFNKSYNNPETLMNKLIWAQQEGLLQYNDIFNEIGEDLLYGRGIDKPEPLMAAKYFAEAAGRGDIEALSGLERSIIELQLEFYDTFLVESYEELFNSILEMQQMKYEKETNPEISRQLLEKAEAQMKEHDFFGASMSYLILAKSDLRSPIDIFGIWSDNKIVKENIERLIVLFESSTNEEDQLWSKQLKRLWDIAIKYKK